MRPGPRNPNENMADLHTLTATDIVRMRRKGEVSALELVEACIDRIEQVDGDINALPIRCYERARASAKKDPQKKQTTRVPCVDYQSLLRTTTMLEA